MVFAMGSKSTTLLLLEWIRRYDYCFAGEEIATPRNCVAVLVVLVFLQSARKIRQSDTQVFGGVTRRRNLYVCGTFRVLLVFITVVVAERGAPSDCAGLYTSCKKESFVLHRRKWIAGTKRRK